MPTLPAHAGQWVITYKCQGQETNYYDDQDHQDNPGPYNITLPTTYSGSVDDAVRDDHHEAEIDIQSSSITASVTAILTWTPDNPSDTSSPTTTVYLRETASAVGSKDSHAPDDPAPISADDGCGDAATGSDISQSSTGSHILCKDNSQGNTVLKLDARSLSAAGGAPNHADFPSSEIHYQVQVTTDPPKSVMIGGGNQTYDGGQWTGKSDTLFNNYEGDPMDPFAGRNYGQLSWSPSLIGGPWPAFADWQAGWFTRDWHWFSDGQSASGSDYTSPPFATDRPHVDWPWDSDGQYIPRDFLEECKNAPASQSKHIFLHLTDSDQLGTHPEWSFDKTANTYVTFHSQHELVEEQATQEVPTSENPWQIIVLRGGTNVQASGPFTSWQPTIYFEANQDFGISFNGAAWILDSGVSFSTGTNQGYNLSVNPQPIPAGQHGAVYWHRSIIRHPFTYNQYTVGGLEYESYDANGVGQPFHGHVDRSRGWPNAPNDMDAKIVLRYNDEGFPETIDHD